MKGKHIIKRNEKEHEIRELCWGTIVKRALKANQRILDFIERATRIH